MGIVLCLAPYKRPDGQVSPQPCWWSSSNCVAEAVGLGILGCHQQLTRMGIKRRGGVAALLETR